MSTLFIAPARDLKTFQPQLQAMAASDGVDVIEWPTRPSEIYRAITSGCHDRIHFGGHSAEGTLYANPDMPIETPLLIEAMKNAVNLDLVVLNGCGTLSLACQLYMAGASPRVIGWPETVHPDRSLTNRNLPDEIAGCWAEEFYRSLKLNGGNVLGGMKIAEDVLERRYPGYAPPQLLNGRLSKKSERIEELLEIQAALAEEVATVANDVRDRRDRRWMWGVVGLVVIDLATQVFLHVVR